MDKTVKNFLLTGCLALFIFSTALPLQSAAPDYRKEMVKLSQAIKQNPKNAGALRDLGVICIKTEKYRNAETFLEKAYHYDPTDAKTQYYYGLSLEYNGKVDEALTIYRHYTDISRLSPYRKLMRSHYDIISRDLAKQEARQVLGNEQLMAPENLAPDMLAVFPLQYRGDNEEYKNLGIGLGEMLITDLSQVPGISLVERIRLNSLMEEVALGQSGMVKEGTAPEYGKLLGAGKVVTGYYDIFDNDNLQVNLEFRDYIKQKPPLKARSANTLKELFLLEKKVVLGIVATMGIELTPEEKKKILYIPTKNLQAFLAYCNGLERQDAGQPAQAESFFRQAVELDPKFEAGREKIEETETISMIQSSSRDELLASIDKMDRSGSTTQVSDAGQPGAQNLLNDRLQTMANNSGAQFIPGQETRKSTEEAITSGAGGDIGINIPPTLPIPVKTFDVLPNPPAPPTLP
ncbi:MAG TPA: CsgG/HfaB family protein [bacterium]|nr:CsgG/HfaB family protein [bacterium]HPN42240.1 CsgG/HfaB family protein [bacterium]